MKHLSISNLRSNYLLYVQICLFTFLVAALLKGKWIGDFWEHAAIIKQFSHSYVATHPLLHIDASHAFYSPYLFTLGFIVKFTGLSAIRVLTLAGIVNAALLLYIFPKFVALKFKNNNVALWCLLFVLFLWYAPHSYSGFISINVLNYVLPYPSTFALILIFFLFVNFEQEKEFTKKKYIVSVILIFTTTICHPLSRLVCCLGFLAIHINKFGIATNKYWLRYAISMIVTISLLLLWPFYSFYELIMGASDVYHSSNKIMYDSPLLRTFPAILAIPIMLFESRTKEKTLIYLFLALILFYAIGGIFEKWSLGRTLSFITIICHIYLAKFFVSILEKQKRNKKRMLLIQASAIIIIAFFAFKNLPSSYSFLQNKWMISEKKYQDLSKHLFEDDAVFATTKDSWPIPTFGPKIVSCKHVQAFVNDGDIRRQDTKSFFLNNNFSDIKRWNIINKYQANKILLAVDFQINNSLKYWISKNTTPIFQDNNYILYKIIH